VNERSALLAGVGILVVAVFAIAAAGLGPSSDRIVAGGVNDRDTPGYRGTTARGATSEPGFELARPAESGPTTIPGSGPTFYMPSSSTPGATSTPTTSTTTTTLPPVPDAPTGDDACLAMSHFFKFVQLGARLDLPFGPFAQYVETQLTDFARLLRSADAVAYQQMIALVDQLIARVEAASDVAGVRAVMTGLLAPGNRGMRAIRPLASHTATACPDLQPTALRVLLGG
jgi:hypothetical protein